MEEGDSVVAPFGPNSGPSTTLGTERNPLIVRKAGR